MINKNGEVMMGAYPAFGLSPEGIIAHDFSNPQQVKDFLTKCENPPSHWVMYGMCNDELKIVYEEKDGTVIINLFMNSKTSTSLDQSD